MKTKYKGYDRWENAFKNVAFKNVNLTLSTADKMLRQFTLAFHNKEHYVKYVKDQFAVSLLKNQPGWAEWVEGLLEINTYNDAILHKNSENTTVRRLCNFIIKGEIEIYE